jgi:ribose transport system substrate-binding protein
VTRPRIVVSLITQDNDYQIAQAAAAEEAARRWGADVEILFADADSILQSQQILRYVQAAPGQRPDGIIFEPVGGPALPQVAQAAVRGGIAWVILNREMEYLNQLRQAAKVPVFAVANDNLEVGRIQGRQIKALLPSGGSVLYIQGPPETDAAKLRTAGVSQTKPANVQLKTMNGNWTEASAFKVVTSWLRLSTSQQSNVGAIAAQNDAMASGAKKAFQQFSAEGEGRDRWVHLPFLGVDGLPKTGQEWVRSSVLAATIITPPLSGTAMNMLVQALETHAMPPETTLIAPQSFPTLDSLSRKNRGGSPSM